MGVARIVVVIGMVGVAACGFPRPADVVGDAGAPDAGACFGALIHVCLNALPTQAVSIDGTQPQLIDTTSSAMCVATNRSDYCVVAATDIMVNGEGLALRATGSRPLVLIATDSIIALSGVIDVGSHRLSSGIAGAGAGAGANPAACEDAPGRRPLSGGGGAGGSFAGRGGGGAPSASANSAGGAPGSVSTVTDLRGGCPGEDGDGSDGGAGGPGGGAVLMIAGSHIIIGGEINAAGEGGGGGTQKTSGGGGGGAGGMIALDAPTVTVIGLLLANGGGGAEGSGESVAGAQGSDSVGVNAASGGSAQVANGGDGGNGSAGVAAGAGSPGAAGTIQSGLLGGGGGGGGGAGFVTVPRTASIAQVSPAATLFVRSDTTHR
jgi:hypothetical protein